MKINFLVSFMDSFFIYSFKKPGNFQPGSNTLMEPDHTRQG